MLIFKSHKRIACFNAAIYLYRKAQQLIIAIKTKIYFLCSAKQHFGRGGLKVVHLIR